MRILHVVSDDSWGGAERVVSLLLDGSLAAPGIECELLVLNRGRLAREFAARGVPVHFVSEAGRSVVGLAREVRAVVARRAPDVVHAHRYKEILLSSWAARGAGLVVTVHGLEPWSQLSWRQRLRIWSSLVIARVAGAKLVAVSGELRRRLARVLGRGAVRQVANPMPPAPSSPAGSDLRAHLGWDSQRPVVGFVGRLERVKGPDLFVEVAASGTWGDVGFVIVGNGSLDTTLRDDLRGRQLDRRVVLLGAVPDAMGWLSQLDVLALTSRHEGLPMILLEAAAAAVPVVAFDVGGVSEVAFGDGGALRVPPGDVGAFRAAVGRLLADRDAARSAARAWSARVQGRFGAGAILEAYRQVYEARR